MLMNQYYPKSKPKKYKLVIVESPAKCKKIEEYLGSSEYKCVATYGHLREISRLENIDISNNYQPTFTILESKKKTIANLKNDIQYAKEVIIASDADREGEMIGFSVVEMFHLPYDTKRIVFNEISATALTYAIKHPTTLNMNLVNAQKARQILDVLVGYKVSPVLWKNIRRDFTNSLSAGRCQSPALKLVFENQKTIDESINQNKYKTRGYFTQFNLTFQLNTQFDDEANMIEFLEESDTFSHVYNCSLPTLVWKQPPEPFTTSKIQQVASNVMHISPKETMTLCQHLYEGGYITYMRTDCASYSDEFMKIGHDYISQHYGVEYNKETTETKNKNKEKEKAVSGKKEKNEKENKNKEKEKTSKTKYNQEAHEAIRPTNIVMRELPQNMDRRERKMYELIWTNTIQSLMSAASYNRICATITAPKNAKYIYNCESCKFLGWKIVKMNQEQGQEQEGEEGQEGQEDATSYQYLQHIMNGGVISYNKITSNVFIEGIKMHYSEAKLVQLLEEKGIGRPSTFASIIDKIQERGYVKKETIQGKEVCCRDFELERGELCEIENKRTFGVEKNKLCITPLGVIVMEFLNSHFGSLFEYEYTSLMEKALDKVANGETIWFEVVDACNREIDTYLELVKDETKINYKIDEHHTYMIGKYGPVIKCDMSSNDMNHHEINNNNNNNKIKNNNKKQDAIQIHFKPVNPNVSLDQIKSGTLNLEDIVDTENQGQSQRILGTYDTYSVVLRRGKHGLYVSLGEKNISIKLDNDKFDQIDLEQVVHIMEQKAVAFIREINDHMSVRKGPRGDYIFYKTQSMKKPVFYSIVGFQEDYTSCELDILTQWIKEQYKVE